MEVAADADGGDLRHGGDVLLDPANEESPLRLRVPVLLKAKGHDHGRIPAETGVDHLALAEAPQEQTRRHQEHERDGDLGHDQHAAWGNPSVPPGPGTHGLRLDALHHVRPGRLQGGHQPEERTRDDRHRQGESQDRGIQGQVEGNGNRERQVRPGQQMEQHAREADAGGTAEQRQQDAFGEKLTHQHPPPGAEGESDGDLPASGARLRQEEARQVGAGDQEDQAYDGE